jgi:hypothetical protein
LLILCEPDIDKLAQAIEGNELSGTEGDACSGADIKITSDQDVLCHYLAKNEENNFSSVTKI